MPRRKTRYPKRKFVPRKKANPQRSLSSIDKVYTFKRWANPSWVSSSLTSGNPQANGNNIFVGSSTAVNGLSNVYDFGASQQFMLSDAATSSEFTALFDQYMISGVKVSITYNYNTEGINTNGSMMPRIYYTTDYDDAQVPASEDVMRNRNSTKSWTFGTNKPLVIYVKPKKALLTYEGNITSGYSPSRGYIDCQNSSAEHYGLKYWIKNVKLGPTTENTIQFTFDTTYYLKFKGVL